MCIHDVHITIQKKASVLYISKEPRVTCMHAMNDTYTIRTRIKSNKRRKKVGEAVRKINIGKQETETRTILTRINLDFG